MEEIIEEINKERLDILNSSEYNLARRTIIFKNLLKKGKIISLIKRVYKTKRTNQLSLKKYVEYGPVIKNKYDCRKKRIAIYTCVTGDYDAINEPFFDYNNVDYFFITDNEVKENESKWRFININEYVDKNMSVINKNRYAKLNPHIFFQGKYDYSIYLDGNIEILSDLRTMINSVNDKYGIAMHNHRNRNCIYKETKLCILRGKGNKQYLKKQIEKYKKMKFPKEYGMLEANLIVVNLDNNEAEKLLKEWWNEFLETKSGRDQISLIYTLWKNNIKTSDLATLGSNIYSNPKIFIKKHN